MRTGDVGSFFRRASGLVLVGALASFGAVVAVSAPAQAATCSPDTQTRGDLDGDGRTDLIVGMPYYSEGSGAVDVRYTGLPSQLLRGGDVGGTSEEGTTFGSAVAVGDLDGDGCADAVIGASREDATAGVGGYIGRVHIVFGSPTGLLTGSAITVDHPASEGSNFDDFGASLALSFAFSGGKVVHDLFVGAPGSSVGGHPDAGAVWRYRITPGGAGRVTIGAGSVRTQDSPGVPGAAETGDRFGEEVTPDGTAAGVVASAPMEDLGKAVNAGAIWQLQGDTSEDSTGAWTTATSFSQDSPGVPGAAETGDHFGSSLSSRGGYVLVGVPDENDGRKKDSGLVQVFSTRSESQPTIRPGKAYTQDSAGVPGAVEAGDRFGAGVAAGVALTCQENVDGAIGAPGEDVGSRADAGSITLIPLAGPTTGCGIKAIRQGSGLNGAAEAGDQVGGVLSITRGATDLDEDYSDQLLIGVPREDIGAHPDAGMVQSNRSAIEVAGALEPALTFSGGQLNSDYYGEVLNTASD